MSNKKNANVIAQYLETLNEEIESKFNFLSRIEFQYGKTSKYKYYQDELIKSLEDEREVYMSIAKDVDLVDEIVSLLKNGEENYCLDDLASIIDIDIMDINNRIIKKLTNYCNMSFQEETYFESEDEEVDAEREEDLELDELDSSFLESNIEADAWSSGEPEEDVFKNHRIRLLLEFCLTDDILKMFKTLLDEKIDDELFAPWREQLIDFKYKVGYLYAINEDDYIKSLSTSNNISYYEAFKERLNPSFKILSGINEELITKTLSILINYIKKLDDKTVDDDREYALLVIMVTMYESILAFEKDELENKHYHSFEDGFKEEEGLVIAKAMVERAYHDIDYNKSKKRILHLSAKN